MHALEFFGGALKSLSPNTETAAVKHPCRYAPATESTYRESAEHYGFAVVPASSLQTSR